MKLHPNAKTTPRSRLLLVQRILDDGLSLPDVAEAQGVSTTTARKWLRRFEAEGCAGLEDRRSAPKRIPHQTPPVLVRQIERLRRLRWTAFRIARQLRLALSTVACIVKRLGLGRLPPVMPPEPILRYQREIAGELVHIDTKKLGRIKQIGHRMTGNRRDTVRGVGWEFAHVAIDDATRTGYVEMLPDERGDNAVRFLRRLVRWYAGRGVRVQSIMTDNGSAYISRQFRRACHELGLRHLRTQPYRPQTNGKAERFIQTLLREWAYVRTYRSSHRSAEDLAAVLQPPTSPHGPRLSNTLGRPPEVRLNNLQRNDN